MVRDVVCGMELDPEAAEASGLYEGVTYYFCSEACMHEFYAEPEKYTGDVGIA